MCALIRKSLIYSTESVSGGAVIKLVHKLDGKCNKSVRKSVVC